MRGYKDPFPSLPPGCTPSDIPGNRPEDVAWEKFMEKEAEVVFLDFYGREPDSIGEIYDKRDEDEEFKEELEEAFEDYRRPDPEPEFWGDEYE